MGFNLSKKEKKGKEKEEDLTSLFILPLLNSQSFEGEEKRGIDRVDF